MIRCNNTFESIASHVTYVFPCKLNKYKIINKRCVYSISTTLVNEPVNLTLTC